jgi:hypothetical protein
MPRLGYLPEMTDLAPPVAARQPVDRGAWRDGPGDVRPREGHHGDRGDEGTTFEASCYTDPLALEHLTGSWRRAVEHFGGWDAPRRSPGCRAPT